jgi:hypothetical protein
VVAQGSLRCVLPSPYMVRGGLHGTWGAPSFASIVEGFPGGMTWG